MEHCQKCGGLIMEPGKVYGYAGKTCFCGQYDDSKATSKEIFNIPEILKRLDDLEAENFRLKRELEKLKDIDE